jgi:PAS domain S-box-containing protein
MKSNMKCQVSPGVLSGFETERFLEVILNNAPEVIVLLATDFTIRMVNRSFTQQTGLIAEKAIGYSCLNLFPDLNKQLDYLLQKSRLTKQSVVSKENLLLPGSINGAALWQGMVHPLYEADVFSGWVLIFKKIGQQLPTALLRTPSCGTLHDSPAQAGLAKVLQAINGFFPLGIAEYDLDGALLDVSEAFLETAGLTWEEGQGYGWMDLIPAEERDRVAGQWREYCRQELSWSIQYRIRCRNGNRRVILSRARPNRDFQGKITSWLVLNFDMTLEQQEREENWQTFQVSQTFFNSVINHAAIGMALYSGNGLKLCWANPKFQDLIAESQYAQTAAGVRALHDFPYAANIKLDQLADRVLAQKTPLTDLTVQFEHSRRPEYAQWRLGIVPVWTKPAEVPDLLITAVNISVADGRVALEREDRCTGKPERLQPAEWEAVIDRLAEGLMVLNQSGKVMVLNRKAVELLGVSPDADYAPGAGDDYEPLAQLYMPDGSKIASDSWPHFRALRGETFENFEVDLHRADRMEVKRLSFDGTRIRSRENQGDLVVLTCSDRTEIQRLQEINEQLQIQVDRRQELIRRLTEVKPQLDPDLCKLYDAANMYGILQAALEAAGEALQADGGAIWLFIFNDRGETEEVYQLWHDEAQTFNLDLSEQPHARLALETKKAVCFTAEEATAGETVWFDATGFKSCLAVPLLEGADRCIGIIFLHFQAATVPFGEVDCEYYRAAMAKYAVVIGRARTQLERSRLLISERRARVRAESKAARWSALLQSLQEGVSVIDASGNIVLRNKMEQQITRVPDRAAVSILDYGSYRWLWPDNTPVSVPQLPGNRLLRGENIFDTEFILEYDDGTRLNVICNGRVIRGEDGQIMLGILVTRDITAMRQMEESRETFIRTVSHDLRNPLTVVSARSQLLQRRLVKQNLAVEAGEAQVIYVSACRMTKMIQEMFDSYRLESNNFKLNKRMIDLAAVIKDLISRIGIEEDLKRLQLQISPGDYRIYADEERLERVVTNLITNALKYSANDQPVLVKLALRADQIVIAVTDFGVGIDPLDLSKVFERYYRSKNVKEASGLGLGLYIVKLIVEAHEGRINVESRLNEGSTFSVSLPILTEGKERDEILEVGNEK